MPLVFAACYQIFVYLAMFGLPRPGTYLPKVVDPSSSTGNDTETMKSQGSKESKFCKVQIKQEILIEF